MKGKFFSTTLVIVAFLFLAPSLRAQEGLKLGFVALPQTTWMLNQQDIDAPQDEFDFKTTYGMAFGPTFGYNFNDHFGFRLNALYSAQGQSYTSINANDEVVTHSRRLDYIKTPLLLSVNTGTEFRKFVFSFAAGYQANFLFRARYRNDDQSYTPDQGLFDNVTDYPTTYNRYSWLDHGPVVDFGLDIKLTYSVFANIHIRADYSLSDAEDKNSSYKLWSAGIPEDVTIYPGDRGVTNNLNGGISIGLTYTFSSY